MDKSSIQQYSFELKKAVVECFVAGESKMELALAFGLGSEQLFMNWMRQWRAGGDEALMPSPRAAQKARRNQRD